MQLPKDRGRSILANGVLHRATQGPSKATGLPRPLSQEGKVPDLGREVSVFFCLGRALLFYWKVANVKGTLKACTRALDVSCKAGSLIITATTP